MTASPADMNAEAYKSASDALVRLAKEAGVTARSAPGGNHEYVTELLGPQVEIATVKMVQGLRIAGLVEGESQADQLKAITAPPIGQALAIGANVSVEAEEFGPSKLVRVKLKTERNPAEIAPMIQTLSQRMDIINTTGRTRF